MVKYKEGYLTKRALTAEIKEVVAKEHNLDSADIIVNWMSSWKISKFPSGLIQKAGKIKLHAIGFKATIFFVYQTKNKRWHMMG